MEHSDYMKARAVESAVFTCLMNAMHMESTSPEKSEFEFKRADRLEKKFQTEYGMHYLTLIELYQTNYLRK